MDLQNANADGMSMGQLQSSFTSLTGAIADMTKQVNAGQAPTVTGGEYGGMGLSEAAPSKANVTGAQNSIAFPSSGHTVSSMNYVSNEKAPLDPLFGMRYTRKQYMELAKREAYALSHIAKKGYMPPEKKSEETFRQTDSVFAKAANNGKTFSACEYAMSMKFMKLTPEMMINLGLIPAAIKSNLDRTVRVMDKPDATQIVNTAMNGENETAQRMFDQSSGDSQQRVAEALGTKNKTGTSKAFKPPKPPEPSNKSGEYLH